MRIALFSLHFAEYSCRLAAALAADHDVLLFLGAQNLQQELEQEIALFRDVPRLTIVVVEHTKSPLQMWRNLRLLVDQTERFRPDVLHLQEDTKDYLFAAVLLLARRYPLVLTVHDPRPHSGEDAKQIRYSRHGAYRKVLRRVADHAITHGAQLCRDLAEVAPRLDGRTTSADHGPCGPQQPPAQAPQAGNLLFFGRINAYKGLRYFLDAVVLLRQRGLDVTGVIAGRGSDLEPNRALIAAHPFFELHEEFIARAKLHTLFERAQMLVMPYVDGTQSGVAAMAQGFGRPVVATNVGAIPEMVLHGVSGLIVPPRDAVALADAIEGLLRAPQRLAEMEAHTRALAGRRWPEIAAVTAAAYRRALQRRAGGEAR